MEKLSEVGTNSSRWEGRMCKYRHSWVCGLEVEGKARSTLKIFFVSYVVHQLERDAGGVRREDEA